MCNINYSVFIDHFVTKSIAGNSAMKSKQTQVQIEATEYCIVGPPLNTMHFLIFLNTQLNKFRKLVVEYISLTYNILFPYFTRRKNR